MDGTFWKNGNASGGGHTIKNSSGTSMTQRDTMQFSSPITVIDDSTNGKTVIDVDTNVSLSGMTPPAVQPDGINSHYAISSTAASTTAKKATSFDGAFSLVEGTKVFVRFSAKNSATNPTLSIDDSTAKPIKGFGTTKPSSWWVAGDVVQFIYDGTSWIMQPTQGQISDVMSDLANKIKTSTITLTYDNQYYLSGAIPNFNAAHIYLLTLQRGGVVDSKSCLLSYSANNGNAYVSSATGNYVSGDTQVVNVLDIAP
jgi:hypothetical protein